MGQDEYQIKPLRDEENYETWKKEVKGLLRLNRCWNIVNDKKSKLDDSSLRSVKTSAREEDDIEYSVIVVTQHTIERWQDEVKKYKKKVKNWDERHDKIVIRIHLNCFMRSRVLLEL